jgi:hypothetical protein
MVGTRSNPNPGLRRSPRERGSATNPTSKASLSSSPLSEVASNTGLQTPKQTPKQALKGKKIIEREVAVAHSYTSTPKKARLGKARGSEPEPPQPKPLVRYNSSLSSIFSSASRSCHPPAPKGDVIGGFHGLETSTEFRLGKLQRRDSLSSLPDIAQDLPTIGPLRESSVPPDKDEATYRLCFGYGSDDPDDLTVVDPDESPMDIDDADMSEDEVVVDIWPRDTHSPTPQPIQGFLRIKSEPLSDDEELHMPPSSAVLLPTPDVTPVRSQQQNEEKGKKRYISPSPAPSHSSYFSYQSTEPASPGPHPQYVPHFLDYRGTIGSLSNVGLNSFDSVRDVHDLVMPIARAFEEVGARSMDTLECLEWERIGDITRIKMDSPGSYSANNNASAVEARRQAWRDEQERIRLENDQKIRTAALMKHLEDLGCDVDDIDLDNTDELAFDSDEFLDPHGLTGRELIAGLYHTLYPTPSRTLALTVPTNSLPLIPGRNPRAHTPPSPTPTRNVDGATTTPTTIRELCRNLSRDNLELYEKLSEDKNLAHIREHIFGLRKKLNRYRTPTPTASDTTPEPPNAPYIRRFGRVITPSGSLSSIGSPTDSWNLPGPSDAFWTPAEPATVFDSTGATISTFAGSSRMGSHNNRTTTREPGRASAGVWMPREGSIREEADREI